jgi:hypothetical protein
MGYDPSVQPCPRCGVPLPATARFCRNCGLTQEVAQDAFWRTSAPYPGSADQSPDDFSTQQAPSGPPNGPFAHARRGSPYPPYPSYASEPPPVKRSFWRSLWGITVIGLLLVMVLGVSAVAIYFYPSLCSVQQRNGLRSDIPLPCGITFEDHLDRSASGTTGPGSEEWVYSVDGTNPAQLKSFYQGKLPDNGWAIPPAAQNSQDFPNGLLACKAPTLAIITGSQDTNPDDNVAPPPGASLLIIILMPTKNLSADLQQQLGASCT